MQSADDLKARCAALERQLAALTSEVASNERKLRQSLQRELRLLHAENLQTLILEMTDGLRSAYGLPSVSLLLSDPDHDIRHLLIAAGTPAESFQNLVITESLTGIAPQYVALRKPWLGAYAACDHQLLFPAGRDLASIAMIPLTHRRQLIGSINLGSDDPGRFTAQHAADFLAHLGVIASFCVENVLNRARLLRSGFTDVLTGWHNRRYLQARMKEELARARRDNARLNCLMLDVDHFKRVNDTWGHVAGDVVLRELANRVEAQIRASDVAARYGGEEFVVLLPNTDEMSAEKLAERIRLAISASPFELPNGEQVVVTVSIGIAGVGPDRDDVDLKNLGDSLIARADVALYRAKSAGRNRVQVAAER
jgi:two-component system cell cycle response regulator